VAQRLVELDGDAPRPPRALVELVVSELLTGAFARSSLTEKVASVRGELAAAGGRVVLFIDEILDLFDSSSLDGAAAEIRLGLSRGEIKILGATTLDAYRKAIEGDVALARHLAPIEVEEPGPDDAFLLLRSVADGLG